MMLSLMLSLSAHSIRTAFSGEEAHLIGQLFHPEIVFLDLGLPGMNGYEVARYFCAAAVLKDAMIALTGWPGEDDRRKTKEAGFDVHLTKPVNMSDRTERFHFCGNQTSTHSAGR